MKCPICNEEMNDLGQVFVTDSVVGEYGYSCPNKHYEFQYCYGASREYIGSFLVYSGSATWRSNILKFLVRSWWKIRKWRAWK